MADDSPVVGSASFEMRASLARLAGDLKSAEGAVQASVDRAEKGARIPLSADASQVVAEGKRAEAAITSLVRGAGSLNRAQLLETSHVVRALVDSVIAGQSPIRAVLQELPRIGQIAAEGDRGVAGLGGAFSGLAKLFNPVVVGIGGVGAALIGLFAIEQSAERSQAALANSLRGIGAASGATVSDLNRIAEASAAAGNGSVAFNKAAEEAFLRVGLTKDQLAPAVGVIQAFAAVSGLEAPHALEALAKALEHPKEGVKALGDGILNLSAEQIRHITLLDEQGQHTQAVTALISAIGGAVTGAKPHLTELGERFSELTGFIQGTINKLGEFLTRLVQVPAAQKLAQLQAQRAQLVADQKEGQVLTTLPDGSQSFAPVPSHGNDAQVANVDRQIAALQKELAADPSSPANTRKAQQAKTGRDQAAVVATLDPELDQINKLKAGIQGARDALKNLVPGGPTAAELNTSIKRGEERVKELQSRGQKKGRTPADTTLASDTEAERALDAATKDRAAADKEAAAATRQTTTANTIAGREALAVANADAQAAAAHASIKAGLDAQTDAIDQKEKELRKAKNDAHATDQLKTLEHARTVDADAARIRDETADRQADAQRDKAARDAATAAIEETAAIQKAEVQSQLDLLRIQGSFALTTSERLTNAQQVLALEKRDAEIELNKTFDTKATNLGKTASLADLQKIAADRAQAQGRLDVNYSAQGAAAARQNQGPLANYRDQLTTETDNAGQKLEVDGLESLSSNLISVATHAKTAQGALHDLVLGFITDLLQLELKKDLLSLLGGPPQAGAASGGPGPIASFLTSLFVPHFASGTSSAPGGLSLVGEFGPELMNVPRGAQILSNSNLRNGQGGGSRSSLSFDLRGAVMTSDLLGQMQGIADATGGQVLGASIAHTNSTVAGVARRQGASGRQDLTRY